MSQETCPDCRMGYDDKGRCWCWYSQPSDQAERSRLLKERVARLESELASARAENEAWRALNDWGQREFCDVTGAMLASSDGAPVRYSMRAHVYGGTHATGPYWYGEGPTPQAAAIDLARKLNLLPTGAKETT